MPLSRRSLSAGALAAMLLAGCAGAPPPPSAPPSAPTAGAAFLAGATPAAEFWSFVLQPVGPVTVGVETTVQSRDCDPGDAMAFDPGPRVDSLAMQRVPGGRAGSMPNACPVDPRFQGMDLLGRSERVVIRGSPKPAPKPR